MKICPRCQKKYPDDNLNFCLEDGSVLAQVNEPTPETVFQTPPRVTQPQPQMPSQPGQASWNTPQQYSMQPPKKSSKTWVWVLLILGLLVLLCGGGFAGLVFIGMQADNANRISTSNGSTPATNRVANSSSTTSSTTTTSGRSDLESVDLSEWVRQFSVYGTTEYVGDELLIAGKQKGFYYVLAAPADTCQTEMADTRVTLRNVDSANSRLGYGLVFHSNPTPLQQGYAFLLDTKKKKYRVVNHTPQKENSVVTWTKSDAIKDGAQENTLEVRDLTDKIELYVNGTMVTSIKNTYGFKGGVVGLYSGDGVKVAFKNLEIRK